MVTSLLENQALLNSTFIVDFKKLPMYFLNLTQPTIGIDFLAKNVMHKSKNFRLQLWDTAGQERFRSLIPSYLKDSQCALIIFDVTNRDTFAAIENWIKLYNENKTGGSIVIVGNKIDLTRDR